MKRSIHSLIGLKLGATDGEVGEIKEFYFDDKTWTIRYLVVETGSWLFGRKVLITPTSLLSPDWDRGIFQTDLSIDQIKNSPEIDTNKPVSRQQELELYSYYPWGNYWGNGLYTGETGAPASTYDVVIKETDRDETNDDHHLRSTDHVSGYNIKAMDGDIGHVKDFLIDDKNWKIDYLVVDTGNWLPGKKVLVSPKWIREIKWITSEVVVNTTIETVKNSPEYNPAREIDDDYEKELHHHYGGIISHII